MKFLQLVGVVTCLHLVSSQNQCTRENLEDVGVVGPLIASSLVAGTQSSPPTIAVRNSTVVCLAVDDILTTYRTASLIVEYTCLSACPVGAGNLMLTRALAK